TPLPFSSAAPPLTLHSFPTRRSSDLPPPPPNSSGNGNPIIPISPNCLKISNGKVPVRSRSTAPGATSSVENSRIIFLIIDCSSRSEEHTSELQSRFDLVCRLLLEKKK